MTRKVRSDPFLNPAKRGHLFQVLIVLGIAHHRKQKISFPFQVVFPENLQRNIEQFDPGQNIGFYPVYFDPQTTLRVYH